MVASKVNDYVSSNGLGDVTQSADQSTETDFMANKSWVPKMRLAHSTQFPAYLLLQSTYSFLFMACGFVFRAFAAGMLLTLWS